MRRLSALIVAAAVLVACVGPTFAQEISQKKDIAVFALSTYDAAVPGSVLGSVDAAIGEVFISIGRFNVLGMTYRLGRGDVDQFIAKIKELKEKNVQIPEKVQMGKEFFTEADLNRIIGAFIVVVPSVTFFAVEGGATSSTTTKSSSATTSTQSQAAKPSSSSTTVTSRSATTVQKDTKGDFHARLQASFTFVDIGKMTAIAQVNVQTDGYDDDRNMAAKEAVDDIPAQLTYEVRKIEEFKLKTGVLEVAGRTVIIELGRNLGVRVGDEYEIVGSRILDSGRTLSTREGLLVIREVSDEVSIAQIIYASQRPRTGDQLKEFPLFGATMLPYAHLVVGSAMGGPVVFLPGIRAVWNRGLFRFKPQVGVEVPLGLGGYSVGGGIPVNMYVGGEMDLYLGRLQINPMVSVGAGGTIPVAETSEFALTHVGFKAGLNATFLLSDKFKLSVDTGFTYWLHVGAFAGDYYGPFMGAGVELKL